ncbi:MAG: hypothetical protein PHO07_16715 [Pirellulales bacterium]|jgi:hypothetical protein|nr:hypothetical protein [Pirellulales bacterium]
MAVIADIADSIVAELNAGGFSQPLSATRCYLPKFDLAEMKDLHVTVVPRGVAVTAGTRNHNQHDYQIDIAVQKKLTAADNGEIDALMSLVDEIADHFRLKRLDNLRAAVWVKTQHEPIYAPEHLDQLRQFTSVLTVTFRMMR